MTALDDLHRRSIVMADTGNPDVIRRFGPQNCTKNQTLVFARLCDPASRDMIDQEARALAGCDLPTIASAPLRRFALDERPLDYRLCIAPSDDCPELVNQSAKHKGTKAPKFLKSSDGSITILALFFFVAMLLAMSLAVDLARYEQQRVQLQGIADRAVLAAANMRFDGDGGISPEDHVRGYFLAAGYSQEQVDRIEISVEASSGGRQVTVLPRGSIPTFLMPLLSIDSLDLATPARAEISAPMPIEIVLVLDISWSMTEMTGNGRTRIENLREAAVAMIDDIMIDRADGDVAITIVPYESWVVPPPGLMAFMSNIDGPETDLLGNPAYCMEFTDWADLRQNGMTTAVSNSLAAPVSRRFCGPLYGNRVVRPLLTQPEAITSVLQDLQPLGSTSIDLGLRYGAMFFDSDISPFIEDEIEEGRISPSMSNRPSGFDQNDTLRIMVLMTDGENCCGLRDTPVAQNENALAVCEDLRDEAVVVFSIAFEAPENGVNLMEECASSESHFFNTNGEGMRATFQAIGRQINALSLRLTI